MMSKGEESIISFFLKFRDPVLKKSKRSRSYSTNADTFLFYCPKCNMVWEYERFKAEDTRQTMYYKDFPSIGKERKNCKKCK